MSISNLPNGVKPIAWNPLSEPDTPLWWSEPRVVHVKCWMGNEAADANDDDAFFAIMALCPRHTFVLTTVLPERMAKYLDELQSAANLHAPRTSRGQFIRVELYQRIIRFPNP